MKHSKFLFLFLLSLILTGCTNIDAKAAETFSIDKVENISVNAQSYQLTVRESTDTQIHVKYTVSKKNNLKVSVKLADEELIISQNDSSDSETLFGGLSFGKTGEINIYIPESYGKSLNISNGSGELDLNSLSLSELNISNDSGYITIKNVKSNIGTIVSDSGDLKLKDSSIDALETNTDSGYISVTNTDATDMKMYSDSGEISINNLLESCNTSIENSSGDITISFKSSPKNLSFNIATNSEDISCKLDNADYSINTPSNKKGNVGVGSHSLTVSSDEGTIIVR